MLLCAQHVLPVSSAPIENGAVLVKDGKIADIGKADMLRIRYAEEEVRDFGTAAICPGLINLYARLEDAIFRGLMSRRPLRSLDEGDLRSSQAPFGRRVV